MPPPLLDQIVQTALPQHCEPSSPLLAALSSHLHICIPTPLALISSILGTLSIVSWLFAQLPQIYKNFQLQSTSGLSLFFLVEWCLGDASNLVGALLTRQAGWQVIVAGYYVLVDVTLVFQYFWYTHYKRRGDDYGELSYSHHDDGSGSVLDGVSFSEDYSSAGARLSAAARPTDIKDAKDLKASGLTGGQSPSYSNEKMSSSRRSVTRTGSGRSLPTSSTRTVLLASMLCAVLANAAPTEPETGSTSNRIDLEFIGRIISWMSTVLYLGSRPPQLYKNYCRKSTSGLSPLLFMAAFGGNFFYSASLLTNPNAWYDFPAYGGGGWADADGNDRLEWVGRAIPFFLGAFGVLGLDGFMGVQFLIYGSNDGESIIEVEDPKRGRSHWTRVRGWMRGWIPSVSPEREIHHSNSTTHERRALLDEDRERYGTV
ncbi:PQ loop repeat protein [Aspergillus affinis]|uniref:PQ loop repeat protein n=1 Tax=Aspergillus affinis TaxID=1070780 RepID=UPI0022FF26DA|nr:PQ loop repeat protein [Aspergillus affinis]KAI9044968.1 PQ loop repeat protein [Aspergillus affinis]